MTKRFITLINIITSPHQVKEFIHIMLCNISGTYIIHIPFTFSWCMGLILMYVATYVGSHNWFEHIIILLKHLEVLSVHIYTCSYMYIHI